MSSDNTEGRWSFNHRGARWTSLPYEVEDSEGAIRAEFHIRGDAERYVRERNREAGIATETGDAHGEIAKHMRGRLDDLAGLFAVVDGEATDTEAEDLEEAEEQLDEYPLCVEATTTFEIVLGTGGPDDRLLIECNVANCSGESFRPGSGETPSYEIRRVLYRYSWSNSAEVELVGKDKEVAERFAQHVVPELA